MKLLFNGWLVGQTKHINNNVNPTWNEAFIITLPLLMKAKECKLVVEVYDHDTVSDHDLLGFAVFEGKALASLLTLADTLIHAETSAGANADTAGTSARDVFILENEEKHRGKIKKVQCGDITLRGTALSVPIATRTTTPAAEASHVATKASASERNARTSSKGIKAIPEDQAEDADNEDANLDESSIAGGGLSAGVSEVDGESVQIGEHGLPSSAAASVVGPDGENSVSVVADAKTQAEKIREDGYQDLHNSHPEEYVISITTVRGLMNTDSLKHRYE